MESIFKTVDKLIKEYPEGDLDDLMIELEQNNPTLDECLEQFGYTRDEALAAAHAAVVHHADHAKEFGIEILEYPYLWAELSEKCKEMSDKKLELILWLMAGGRLTERNDLTDDEVIADWLHVTRRAEEIKRHLDRFIKTAVDFSDITVKLTRSKIKEPPKNTKAEAECILKLLMDKGYAENFIKDILSDNIITVSGIISGLPFLEPIKPLIYFQIYAKHRKKMFGTKDFLPNIKKIFTERQYDLTKDNGKNFKQYAIYCALYSDLKKCFPKANVALCDTGFLLCSNLADWWHSIGAEYTRNPNMNIPLTIDGLIMEQCVTCFEKSEVGRTMNVSPEQLIKWRESNKKLCENAQKLIQNIKFSDLLTFVDNSTEFCAKLFDQKLLEGDNHIDYDIAWTLFVQEVEERFDELLEEELSLMISKWLISKIDK